MQKYTSPVSFHGLNVIACVHKHMYAHVPYKIGVLIRLFHLLQLLISVVRNWPGSLELRHPSINMPLMNTTGWQLR